MRPLYTTKRTDRAMRTSAVRKRLPCAINNTAQHTPHHTSQLVVHVWRVPAYTWERPLPTNTRRCPLFPSSPEVPSRFIEKAIAGFEWIENTQLAHSSMHALYAIIGQQHPRKPSPFTSNRLFLYNPRKMRRRHPKRSPVKCGKSPFARDPSIIRPCRPKLIKSVTTFRRRLWELNLAPSPTFFVILRPLLKIYCGHRLGHDQNPRPPSRQNPAHKRTINRGIPQLIEKRPICRTPILDPLIVLGPDLVPPRIHDSRQHMVSPVVNCRRDIPMQYKWLSFEEPVFSLPSRQISRPTLGWRAVWIVSGG